jgi:hypothetical protein
MTGVGTAVDGVVLSSSKGFFLPLPGWPHDERSNEKTNIEDIAAKRFFIKLSL